MTDKLIDYVKDTAPGGIRTSAETLVRSETAHFMNQGQRMAYEEIGIKQYRFVAALSELTCDTCGNLDGSVFDTDKAVEGENFPTDTPALSVRYDYGRREFDKSYCTRSAYGRKLQS